jgi:hypothetical protein
MAEAATSADSPSPPAAGRGRLKPLSLIGLGLLVLVAGFLLYRHRQTADRLRLALDELDRKDPGWRLEEVEAARTAVPDAENGGLIVREIPRLLPKGWPPASTDEFFQVPPPEMYSAAAFTRLEAELKPLEPALDLARRMAWFPNGRLRLEWTRNPIVTLLPEQQEVRRVTNLLVLDARRHAQAGHMKEAFHSCQAALNGARTLGDEPLIISQLIRIACVAVACQAVERTLAQGEPDPKDLEDLQKMLELEDSHDPLTVALRGERGALHRVFELVESGELSMKGLEVGPGDKPSGFESFLPLLGINDARAEHPLFLSLMNRHIEAASLPLHQQAAAERDIEAQVKSLGWNARLTRLLLPAVGKFGEATRRTHANLRCLLVAVAAERYRRAQGRWLAAPADLVPQFVAAVPLDPYDGKPLRIRALPDGVVVYSIGPDGTDDGGHIDRDNPAGKGTDLGYRLWDVKHRRQPPRPAPAPAGGGIRR